MLLWVLACSEYDVQGKKDFPGAFDSSDPPVSPLDSDSGQEATEEICNGMDDNGDGEVDEGFPDSDGDGLKDCLEQDCTVLSTPEAQMDILEECQGTGTGGTVTDPWNARIEWQYTTTGNSMGVIVMPAVGNLTDDNGDGRIDENDMPDVAFSKPAPLEGGPFVTAPGGKDSVEREPRVKTLES